MIALRGLRARAENLVEGTQETERVPAQEPFDDETSRIHSMVERLVLVADSERDGAPIQSELRAHGYCAELACTGQAVLARFLQEPRPRALVLEQRLPDCSGLDLIAPLRLHAPELRIIVLTAFPSVAAAVHALRSGAHDYLCKPAFLWRIEQALTGGRGTHAEPEDHPSLDRAIWEYINYVVADAGSIAGAARRLRIDRRSLRRMLQKFPPAK